MNSPRMKPYTIFKESVKSLFDYNPETGHLTWKVFTNSRAPIGSRTGTVKKRGYRQFKFQGRDYYEHQVIWLWVYGEWPKNYLDHINRNKADNRLCNLRDATCSENLCNTNLRSDNSSGVKGIAWDKSRNKWRASVEFGGALKMKRFTSFEEACLQIREWRVQLHGEFAN